MGLDDLLARLERAAGTAGTADVPADVPSNPLQTLAGTAGAAGAAGAAEKDKGGGDSSIIPTDTAPPIREARWLLHYADREPMEVHFASAADHDEVLCAYRDAVAAEPLVKSACESAKQSAHESALKSAARGCSTCRHRKRPGLSPGYCGGRDDLPGAYGEHHPLRKLPADQGASCASYRPHED